jgi:hypothetical protein
LNTIADPEASLLSKGIAIAALTPVGKFGKALKFIPTEDLFKIDDLVKSNKVDDVVEKKSDSVGDVAGKIDNIPRISEIDVNFKQNPKHDAEEFARQLKDQEKGFNDLTIDEYLKNRERYLKEGRALEGNAAQKLARQEALKEKVLELRKQGLSRQEANKQAEEWLGTQAALHNPDQIAGGNPLNIGGMGDKKINSSIGSQWKFRIDATDEQIREITKNMTESEKKSTYLNVKLKH